jgi:D-arabinose 1-dehydrogenase-like Zn-dependent alcohol dehydrogenase
LTGRLSALYPGRDSPVDPEGVACGIATDSEDTLRFAEMSGVRPMIEKFPLAKAAEGYARMMSGKAQFRAVLTM